MPAVRAAIPTPRWRGTARNLMRALNRAIMLLAGTRWLPLYGVITHRGRRSGATFHTPVVVRPTADGFVVPMPWGVTTDWYRNVRAAGECVIRWKGREFALVQPEVIATATASAHFTSWQRLAMSRLGLQLSLRLRYRDRPDDRS